MQEVARPSRGQGLRSTGSSASPPPARACRPSFAPVSPPSSPWPKSYSSTRRSWRKPGWIMARRSLPPASSPLPAPWSWDSTPTTPSPWRPAWGSTHILPSPPELGGNWQLALGLVVLSGVLFFALSLSPLRAWFDAIPMSLKLGIAAGIGFFLALENAGIVADDPATLASSAIGLPRRRCCSSPS